MATKHNATKRTAAKTASPTRDTAPVTQPEDSTPDADEQTYIVGHDGKRVKTEAYRESDEFKGIVKDN